MAEKKEIKQKLADDEMYCPECGGIIKKGFYTCSNCKMKVRLTKEIKENKGSD